MAARKFAAAGAKVVAGGRRIELGQKLEKDAGENLTFVQVRQILYTFFWNFFLFLKIYDFLIENEMNNFIFIFWFCSWILILIQVDVSDFAQLEAFFEKAATVLGKFDYVLVILHWYWYSISIHMLIY